MKASAIPKKQNFHSTNHKLTTMNERLDARMEGAKAALEGRKLDANTYDENDDLHFEWLAGWTSARMKMIQHSPRLKKPENNK